MVPGGRRAINRRKVLALAKSIEHIGLINPISIDKNGRLIAGAHRLAAHKHLGRKEIECIVLNCDKLYSKLAEIDENLLRNDLDPIGIGEHAIRRDEMLEALGVRAKRGDNRFTKDRPADSAPLQTTAYIAKEIGMSERSLQVSKQLARDLTTKAKKAIRKIDATKQDALKLSRKNHEDQEAIAKKMLDGDATTVPEAIREVEREKMRTNLEGIAAQRVKKAKGVYDVIVVDPPWDMKKIELNATPKQVGFEYPTMTEKELSELKIPAADNCHLWIWAPQRFLPSALRLLEAWGFKYSCTFVWHKPDGIQPFRLPKFNCEFAISLVSV